MTSWPGLAWRRALVRAIVVVWTGLASASLASASLASASLASASMASASMASVLMASASLASASLALASGALGLSGCSRPAPDATPEGVVRLWLEKMEGAADDGRAMRDAYQLLGPRARANLKERAERATRGQGRRFEPHEMLAEGRFGLRFRPKTITARVEGDDAWVEIKGDGSDEHATVKCVREGVAWRIEPELPNVVAPAHRPDGGS